MAATQARQTCWLLLGVCLCITLATACGDSTLEKRDDGGSTVPPSLKTGQTGPNANPQTPPITTPGSGTVAAPETPALSGDPAEAVRERLENEFPDESWYPMVQDVVEEGDTLVMTIDNSSDPLSDLDLDKACTVLAGTIFSPVASFEIEAVEVQDRQGSVLARGTGPQCQVT